MRPVPTLPARLLLGTLGFAAAMLASAQSVPAAYRAEYLGIDPGAINAVGQVVGTYNHSFRPSGGASWSAAIRGRGDSMDFDALYPGGEWGSTTGVGINDSGAIVGYQQCCGQSFLWHPANGATGRGGPGWISMAYDLNNAGQAVGESDGQAILWDAQGLAQVLGPGIARAINERGQVVGTSRGSAFIWSPDDGMQIIAPGSAVDINDRGVVVGTMAGGNLWTADGGLRDVDFRGGVPAAINNFGMVVGQANGRFGFVWTEASGAVDLNTLIGPGGTSPHVFSAVDVNDAGMIAAVYAARFPVSGGLLLTPIPEPATLLLFAAGAVFLVTRRGAVRPGR